MVSDSEKVTDAMGKKVHVTYVYQHEIAQLPLDEHLLRLRQLKRQVKVLFLDLRPIAVQRRWVVRAIIATIRGLGSPVVLAPAPGACEIAKPCGEARLLMFSDN